LLRLSWKEQRAHVKRGGRKERTKDEQASYIGRVLRLGKSQPRNEHGRTKVGAPGRAPKKSPGKGKVRKKIVVVTGWKKHPGNTRGDVDVTQRQEGTRRCGQPGERKEREEKWRAIDSVVC